MNFLTHIEILTPPGSAQDKGFFSLLDDGVFFDVKTQGTALTDTKGKIRSCPRLIEDEVRGTLHRWVIDLYEKTSAKKQSQIAKVDELIEGGMSRGFASQMVANEIDEDNDKE